MTAGSIQSLPLEVLKQAIQTKPSEANDKSEEVLPPDTKADVDTDKVFLGKDVQLKKNVAAMVADEPKLSIISTVFKFIVDFCTSIFDFFRGKPAEELKPAPGRKSTEESSYSSKDNAWDEAIKRSPKKTELELKEERQAEYEIFAAHENKQTLAVYENGASSIQEVRRLNIKGELLKSLKEKVLTDGASKIFSKESSLEENFVRDFQKSLGALYQDEQSIRYLLGADSFSLALSSIFDQLKVDYNSFATK